jgi:hypothetical protein
VAASIEPAAMAHQAAPLPQSTPAQAKPAETHGQPTSSQAASMRRLIVSREFLP